jgi:hypothetical protein
VKIRFSYLESIFLNPAYRREEKEENYPSRQPINQPKNQIVSPKGDSPSEQSSKQILHKNAASFPTYHRKRAFDNPTDHHQKATWIPSEVENPREKN